MAGQKVVLCRQNVSQWKNEIEILFCFSSKMMEKNMVAYIVKSVVKLC